MNCQSCGAALEANMKFCVYCGAKTSDTAQTQSAGTPSPAPTPAVSTNGNIPYYKEFPDVPDFGAVTGAPLLRTEKAPNEEVKAMDYIYDPNSLTQELIAKYRTVLEQEGYACNQEDEEFYAYSGNFGIDITIYNDGCIMVGDDFPLIKPTIAKFRTEARANPVKAATEFFFEIFPLFEDPKLTAHFVVVSPDFDKKLKGALTYAQLQNGEEPLIVMDTTTFGNAKTGALLTTHALYMRGTLGKPVKILFEAIKSFSVERLADSVYWVKANDEFVGFVSKAEDARLLRTVLEFLTNTFKQGACSAIMYL